MPIDIQIQPLLDSLDVFGAPDASSAYSLSGHIAITLLPSRSFFERPHLEKYALESLELTFEGQSELVSDATGYAAMRLCSIKRELVHSEPIELANEELNHTQPPKWEFVFDMPIPGWLPATSPFRESHPGCQAGTQYNLHVTARLRDLSRDVNAGLMASVLCGIFRAPFVTRSAQCPITLNRFYIANVQSNSDTPSLTFPSIPYTVRTSVQRPVDTDSSTARSIPLEVLSGIEVLAELPEHCGLDQTTLPFSLRIRAGTQFPQHAYSKTKIVGFNLDVRQHESYCSAPRSTYINRFPVPSSSQQPPKVPLLSPHSLRGFYELGVAGGNSAKEPAVLFDLDFSLLPRNSPQASYRVANGGLHLHKDDTISFDASLHLKEDVAREGDEVASEASGKGSRRCFHTSFDSPFLRVRHQLHVELICQFEHDAGADNPHPISQEVLRFSLPLHFVISTRPFNYLPSSSSVSLASSHGGDAPRQAYAKHPLMKIPAYSQLFYPNGDPRLNEWEHQGEQLPAYCKEKDDDPEPSSQISSSEDD